ncbi:outer membrane protein assembly factor BamE [Candidatus Pseudomonas adelgestsugas]|uniref:Outer membrane protein assembly factor BamE n=1 Tax=Candidatus Pseudomonas adelgestsugas TaxID=1302376 RepID=A0ABX5R885_9PSED|nr:outer membrane protein assembly factor BamE [Candidatus Pseudomonas adelgestsugas]QAX81709.1 Outer membrane protein assembly factor BamE precursor [Candidatus Pseudomonas adelgestsugas]
MQNIHILLTSVTIIVVLALTSCSFPKAYKNDIQQGNVITQDMINQLRPGMTRRQVQFIMGTPLLTNTFDANCWDYLYSMQSNGSGHQQKRVSLIFNVNDQLVSLSGDFMPDISHDKALLGKENITNMTANVRKTEKAQPEVSVKSHSLLDQIQKDIDGAKTVPVPAPQNLDTSAQ